MAETLRELGRIDVLINNAAYLARSTFTTLAELDAASWQRQLAVNLTAPFVLSRAVAPSMRERGAGRIVNVTSVAAVASSADALNGKRPLAYGPSKAALNRLTELLAGELGPEGIAVVALDPGSVRSETYELAASELGVARAGSQPDESARARDCPPRQLRGRAAVRGPHCGGTRDRGGAGLVGGVGVLDCPAGQGTTQN